MRAPRFLVGSARASPAAPFPRTGPRSPHPHCFHRCPGGFSANRPGRWQSPAVAVAVALGPGWSVMGLRAGGRGGVHPSGRADQSWRLRADKHISPGPTRRVWAPLFLAGTRGAGPASETTGSVSPAAGGRQEAGPQLKGSPSGKERPHLPSTQQRPRRGGRLSWAGQWPQGPFLGQGATLGGVSGLQCRWPQTPPPRCPAVRSPACPPGGRWVRGPWARQAGSLLAPVSWLSGLCCLVIPGHTHTHTAGRDGPVPSQRTALGWLCIWLERADF